MKDIQKEIKEIEKGNLKELYLILGQERYFIEKIKEKLFENTLDEDSRDLNFISFDMEENTINDAVYEASSLPFFGNKKLVFVENPYFLTGKRVKNALNHQMEEFEDYLKQPADFTVFVLFAPYEKLDRRKKITKLIEKNAKIINVSEVQGTNASRYIKELAQDKGYHFTKESFQLFTERTDNKLSAMMHELDKLFLYHKDTKEITKESVAQLITRTFEQNVFELNHLVLTSQVEASISLYQDLLIQKEEPIKIVALLISQFRRLLQVKILSRQGYQQGEIAKILKSHPYPIKLALKDVSKYNKELLSEALHYLIDADYKMKTGQIDHELQVELFIMKFAQQKKLIKNH